jgi:hypothetical protein
LAVSKSIAVKAALGMWRWWVRHAKKAGKAERENLKEGLYALTTG